jgi:hypothetical protein
MLMAVRGMSVIGKNAWIYDTGASGFTTWDRGDFVTFEAVIDKTPQNFLKWGRDGGYITGRGTVRIPILRSDGERAWIHIHNAQFVEGFITKLASRRVLRSEFQLAMDDEAVTLYHMGNRKVVI